MPQAFPPDGLGPGIAALTIHGTTAHATMCPGWLSSPPTLQLFPHQTPRKGMLNTSPSDSEETRNGKFDAVKSSLKRLVALYIENAKLTAAEKLTLLVSAAVLFIAAFLLATIAIAFGAVALLQLLELALSPIAAAAIMAGFFALLALLIFLLRKPLIVNPTARFMSKLIMDIGKDRLKD